MLQENISKKIFNVLSQRFLTGRRGSSSLCCVSSEWCYCRSSGRAFICLTVFPSGTCANQLTDKAMLSGTLEFFLLSALSSQVFPSVDFSFTGNSPYDTRCSVLFRESAAFQPCSLFPQHGLESLSSTQVEAI